MAAWPVLEIALAWAVARMGASPGTLAAARKLRSFARGLSVRPPLLDGARIAELFDLPVGPVRAEAVEALRLARARGAVRTKEQAVKYLAAHLGLGPRR